MNRTSHYCVVTKLSSDGGGLIEAEEVVEDAHVVVFGFGLFLVSPSPDDESHESLVRELVTKLLSLRMEAEEAAEDAPDSNVVVFGFGFGLVSAGDLESMIWATDGIHRTGIAMAKYIPKPSGL